MKNIRLISRYFLLSLICCLFVACKYDIYQVFFRGPVVDDRASSITDIAAPAVDGDGVIKFAIITDLHYGSGKSQGENQLIKNLPADGSLDFIVVLGDVVETGFDEYFEQCEDFIGKLKTELQNQDLPIYVVLGNHDLYYNGLGRWKQLNFSKNKGASFFRFKTTSNGTTRSWYFLDTASAVVGTRQMKALSNEMKSDSNPKIVFTHYPIFVDKEFSTPFKLSDPREQVRLIDLFDKNKVDIVFSGHWHDGGTISYGYFSEVCCASFVENSVKQSSWFVLTLQEGTTPTLSIEHFKARGDDISSSIQEYSLQNGR